MRWSRPHRAWVRNRDYAPHAWVDTPGEILGRPDAPSEEDRAEAATLALELTRRDSNKLCQRCWQQDPGLHFIAPNVFGHGDLLRPGAVLHGRRLGWRRWSTEALGQPYGCQSFKSEIDSGPGEPHGYIGLFAGYAFGRPLPAEEVIARQWCSRCQGRAYNVLANTGGTDSEWVQRQVKTSVRVLARRLVEYYGES
ncbi:MAG: hypothetical protein JWR34_2124 [Mycobacterium sp.]|nr:hypothetical protein [Mycobacterium sp.]